MAEGNAGGLNELREEEEKIIAEFSERYKSHTYRPSFDSPPSGGWKLDTSFVESYFEAAKLLLDGIVRGSVPEGVGGPPACFLCRHYLELALKYSLFHSRWLTDEDHNAQDDQVAPVGKKDKHGLLGLWCKLHTELSGRVPSLLKIGLDLSYVEEFIKEFDKVDPNGESFRYAGESLAVSRSRREPPTALGIDFDTILSSLELAHDILGDVDSRLFNQYGENQEWEEEQNSW